MNSNIARLGLKLVVSSRVALRTKISLTLVAVGSIFWFLNALPSRFEVAEKYSNEIDGRPRDQGGVPRICDVLSQKHGEVRISILVTPNSLRNFQNIFQTSDLNAGIRLEIDENGSAGVIVAGEKLENLLIVSSPSRLSVGKRSSISILIAHDSGVTMSIDDIKSTLLGTVNPKCNRLRTGVGFDDTRGFDGMGSIKLEAGINHKQYSTPAWLEIFGQMSIALGSLIWAVGDTFTRSDRTPSDEQSADK